MGMVEFDKWCKNSMFKGQEHTQQMCNPSEFLINFTSFECFFFFFILFRLTSCCYPAPTQTACATQKQLSSTGKTPHFFFLTYKNIIMHIALNSIYQYQSVIINNTQNTIFLQTTSVLFSNRFLFNLSFFSSVLSTNYSR